MIRFSEDIRKAKVCFILDTVNKRGSSTIGFLSNFCSETKKNYLGLVRKQSHIRKF